MNLYRLDKYFFDFILPTNEYVILYHTVIRILFFRASHIQVVINQSGHSYTHNTRLSLIKFYGKNLDTREGSVKFEGNHCAYKLRVGDLKIDLQIGSTHPSVEKWPAMTIGGRSRQFLQWTPVWLKALFTGHITGNPDLKIDKCTGYIDHVFSNYHPGNMPVTLLFWGRLHHRELDLAFTVARLKNKPEMQCMVIIHKDEIVIALEECIIEQRDLFFSEDLEMEIPNSYSITSQNKVRFFKLDVEHKKPAIISRFADNPNFKGKIKRKVLKWLIRDPRGIKYYSTGNVIFELNGIKKEINDVQMISEVAGFKK